jgi:flagellar FliL protein
MTQAMLAAKPERTVQPPEPPPTPVEPDAKEEKEVDLGAYDVSSYQPLSDTTLRISLHLYGTVLVEDENEIIDLMKVKQQRMREQVLVILRSAELTDLTDAGLGLIKRRILEKTNRTFGKPLLQQIVFSEFSFLEQ